MSNQDDDISQVGLSVLFSLTNTKDQGRATDIQC